MQILTIFDVFQRCKRMAGKAVLWMVALFVLLHLSVGKPVDKRGPPPIQPVEGGSKEEEDMVRH